MTTHKSFSARADIEAILADRGAARTDVPVLQPADPFLDTAGEELRRRIFLTQSDTGAAMCLRPEFTIPVCLQHIAQAASPQRYGYVGTVFRQQRDGSPEFLQAGIEDIGDENVIQADARSLADAQKCLHALNVPDAKTLLGDQAVFDAVLAALGLPAGWRLQLTHAFGNDAALKAALSKLAEPAKMPVVPDEIQAALEVGSRDDVETLIGAHLAEASLANTGGRNTAQITARLFAKVRAAQSVPDAEKLETLRVFLSLRSTLDEAAEKLRAFEAQHGLDIADALANFDARCAAIRATGLDLAAIHYDASFGRPLDYYTGLVYEMRNADRAVLAGGGRYDRLLPLLGAAPSVKGVGFSLWLDRIAETAQ